MKHGRCFTLQRSVSSITLFEEMPLDYFTTRGRAILRVIAPLRDVQLKLESIKLNPSYIGHPELSWTRGSIVNGQRSRLGNLQPGAKLDSRTVSRGARSISGRILEIIGIMLLLDSVAK